MRHDPYVILGVKRDASQKEIQRAFRTLAKKHHPDLNPGDQRAEELFKEISAAHQILGDEDKRARFDRGEIDISGAESARYQQHREYAGAAGASPFGHGSQSAPFGFDDIFASFMSRRAGGSGFSESGADIRYSLDISFLDAINGTTANISLGPGSALDIKIPAGTRDGQVLRLRGKGAKAAGRGRNGDALIEIRVRDHAFFTRDGDDIHVEVPISIKEAVLGGRIKVPTPGGYVYLTLKPRTNSGTVLRLKGKGAAKSGGGQGDLLVTVQIVLPDKVDAELTDFLETWSGGDSDPRRNLTL